MAINKFTRILPKSRHQGQGTLAFPLTLLVIVFIAFVFTILNGGVSGRTTRVPKRAAAYQAVFLSNGQVYFGHIAGEHARSVFLTDVYYLRTQQRLQAPAGESGATDAAPASPQLTLVKLGDELHGPMDRMEINRDHVLYIEDLKTDGQVVQTIERHKSSQ